MAERMDQLEMKIAYLEQANAQLSDELYKQRQELDELRQLLAAMSGRLEDAQSLPTAYTPENEKPPHY